MKICIPTESGQWLESKTSDHFGTAPFFTFIDVDTDTYRVVPNPECHNHHGTCHHVPLLTAHEIDAIVCTGIGRRALSALRDAGIEALAAPDKTVGGVVRAVRDGTARPLPAHHACEGGHSHRHRGHSHHGSGRCGHHEHGAGGTTARPQGMPDE